VPKAYLKPISSGKVKYGDAGCSHGKGGGYGGGY
jgi:hypothetical protein